MYFNLKDKVFQDSSQSQPMEFSFPRPTANLSARVDISTCPDLYLDDMGLSSKLSALSTYISMCTQRPTCIYIYVTRPEASSPALKSKGVSCSSLLSQPQPLCKTQIQLHKFMHMIPTNKPLVISHFWVRNRVFESDMTWPGNLTSLFLFKFFSLKTSKFGSG